MAKDPETDQKTVAFRIGVEGNPEKPIDATLYAFDAQGGLIASAPVRDGVAQLDVKPFRLRRARLFVAPTLPEGRGEKPTISTLEKLKAYEATWRFERGRSQYEILPIPEALWPYWGWCGCRVRGRVIKVETLGGVTYEKPVCHARVHICEVDRIPWIIARLPDEAIYRLRDELIVAFDRFAVNPNPPDPVGPRASRVFGRLDAVALNPQPLPPKDISVPLELRGALLSGSTLLVRDALIKHVELIRIYWCHLDWIDRFYSYLCDELTVIETDEHGRFDTIIWYLCDDHPDLYFWVEYSIGGAWETVYRPEIRCHTYWDYACGSEITIRVHDPRVHGCGTVPVPPLGKKVVVKTIARQVSMGEIYRHSPDATKEGLVKEGWINAVKPSPFGSILEPRVDFGLGLKPAGITHYRWSYRTLGSMSEADWKVIDEPVSRHYRVSTPPFTPTIYSSAPVGPDNTVTGYYAFVEPALPANGEDWEVLDESYDLASAFFKTSALLPGKYELKLELFKNVGGTMQRVDLTAESVELYEITDPAPLVEGSYTTTLATGDRVLTDPGTGHIVGYRLVLHVDNRVCFGTIEDVVLSGMPAGRCGFLEYSNVTETARISFRASHPANFATFDFDLARVATPVAEGTASGLVDDASANGFTRASDTFSKDLSVDTLMRSGLPAGETPCTRAAFAEHLHVSALATDGYAQLSGLDAPRPEDLTQVGLRAFAITHA
ncbi:MAG TPA: hypothetical protein VH394_06885 [Thermoanaerobaculia bacterium]|jgi:hypothetical protein|nr:hypothetical protein [Thermoanaerobaculia bacterium]